MCHAIIDFRNTGKDVKTTVGDELSPSMQRDLIGFVRRLSPMPSDASGLAIITVCTALQLVILVF